MPGRLPPDSLAYYFSLGTERSYQAVADHFGVSKTAVANRATEENWQARVEHMERKAQESVEAKVLESVEEMNVRHLRIVKAIQSRALEALKSMPLNSAMAAVKALDLAIKQERLIRGEPSERSAVSIEDTIRREFDRWLTTSEKGEEWSHGDGTDGGAPETGQEDSVS